MADINEVFKPYDPDKPKVSFNLPSKEEVLAAILGLIPGGRAMYSEYKNPDITWKEYGDLVAEDVVPLYNTVIRPAATGDDIEWKEAAKEAAIFGIPLPYTKFPKGYPRAGETIPNNLKEGLGGPGWAAAKSAWKHNSPKAKKLYTDPNARRTMYRGGNTEGGLSTRSSVNTTSTKRMAVDLPAGPYRETNTGSNVINRGQQAIGNNTVSFRHGSGNYNGVHGWQGDMYPSGRSLRKDDVYGPHQWEDKYSYKLDNVINENENKWEYLINKTRPTPNGRGVVPKQEIIDIAMAQGRPDIAARVITDNKPRVSTQRNSPNYDKRFESYYSNQQAESSLKDNAKWKDMGNRQVEKELREVFASLPENPDVRRRFTDHYGVPDLYESWMNDPLPWARYKDYVQHRRIGRERTNRSNRRRAGWENPNQ